MADTNNGTARKQLLISERQLWITIIGTVFAIFAAVCGILWRANSAYDAAQSLLQRVADTERNQAIDRLDITTINANLAEVETQFCSQSQTINLMHANDMRVQAMLWQKTMGQTLPTDNAYYPTLGCITKPESVRR